MSRKTRKLAITAGAGILLVLLTLAAAFYAAQTSWFKNKVRESVIAAIERSSGGTVELAGFDYDWRTLTAQFRGLVVHGTESADQQPLFRADSIRVGLKIVSVFKRDVDIASLVVDRPQIHLFVAPNGSTNIPSPKLGRRTSSETVDALLNLKVRHFELDRGAFEIDARAVPLSARGENVSLVLTYNRRGPRYNVGISSDQFHVDAGEWPSLDAQFHADAQLERDRVTIQRANFVSAGSKLQASGTLQHFGRPVADFKITSQLAGADLARMSTLAGVRAGEFTLNGTGHYDRLTSVTFSGTMAGRNVAFQSASVTFRNIDFQSDLLASREEAKFTRLTIATAGSHLTGQATLPHYRELLLDGTLAGLNIDRVGAWISDQRLPWSGVAAGFVHLSAFLRGRSPNFILQSRLQIAPGTHGIPLSGAVDITYRGAGNAIEFGASHLTFPNTELSFSGTWGALLQVVLDSRNLDDLKPALGFASSRLRAITVPALLSHGTAHFDGTIAGPLDNPQIAGNLALAHFRMQGQAWHQLHSRVAMSANRLEFSSASIDQAPLHATATGRIALENWTLQPDSALRLQAQFKGADLVKLSTAFPSLELPVIGGLASGALDIEGSVLNPHGTAQLAIDNIGAYGESLNRIQMTAMLNGEQVQITRGRAQAGPALMSFSGIYKRSQGTWRDGDVQIKIDSNGFPLASLAPVHKYAPGLDADFEIHGEAAAHVTAGHVEARNAGGTLVFRKVTINHLPYGSVTLNAATRGQLLDTSFSGDLRGTHLSGAAQVQLVAGNPAKGEFRLDRIALSTLNAIVNPSETKPLPVDGFLTAALSFQGPLAEPARLRGTLQVEHVELTSSVAVQKSPQAESANLIFHNASPIVLEAANGVATIRNFELSGKDTRLTVTGSIPYLKQRPMNLNVNGSLDLRFFQLLDPNVQSSGVSLVAASIGGTLSNPAVNGTVELKNGSFFFSDLPNGLTAVNGAVKFDRDRATIQNLTAQTGGGELSLTGFLTFAGAGPLVYRLEANADNVRVRYAGGVSVTASSQLRLTGTSENSILSGTATVSRVVFNPNTDVGNLLASAAIPSESPSNEKDFLTGMQFDVRVESAPNLQLNTELSRDVQAGVDLRLRGTPAHPILLGSIVANQGDIRVFGTKYSINRGEVNFVNPVKIEPVLDLDLQTQARGITVDITISGTLGKLNINYRSDPPLQPRDIVALLTVGRTPDIASNVPNAQVATDVTALESGANTVLGQAISPVSNRLSKLFGITNIKIDPMVQGITNTPQARLTVEQNISRQITVTYVTNLSETSEQIFRLEWAFSPQYSLVALRDDNGEFGIDIQYRKRFK